MRKKTKLVLTVNQRRHIERELLRVTSVTKVARSSHVPPKLVKFVKQELIKKKKLTGNEIRQSVKKKTNAFQKESIKSTPIKTCLLYTSPSPRDGLLSRMPSSA